MAGEEVIAAGAGLIFLLILEIVLWAVFALAIIAVFLATIGAFIFWIFMLVDAIKRKFRKDNDRIIWILIIVLAGIIGAIIYYFLVKKKDSFKKSK